MINKTLLSIVIPARNEAQNILATIIGLSHALTREALSYEILIVDDGSSDETRTIVTTARSATDPNVRLVSNIGPNGFGRAVRLGLTQANGEYVVICMADASDSPDDVIRYYQVLLSGVDCVFGSRFIKGSIVSDYPLFKLVINRIVNKIISILFRMSYNDTTNAFKAYNMRVIRGCEPLISPHFNLTIELPLKAIIRGYSYAVIPISWTNRRHGVSSLKLQEMGSRYLFSLMVCYLEYLLTGKDYRRVEKA